MELGWPAGIGSLSERGGECNQVRTRAGAATGELQPADQTGRGEGTCSSMAPGSLAGDDSGETLKRSSAAPSALQSVLPCSNPPCCLHCHKHLHPASSLLRSQHLPDKILLTSPARQERPESYKSPPWWKACLQLGTI